MKCPKCSHQGCGNGNFCCECGNRLREKCPDCGEMEPIGRPACLTKFAEMKNYVDLAAILPEPYDFGGPSMFFAPIAVVFMLLAEMIFYGCTGIRISGKSTLIVGVFTYFSVSIGGAFLEEVAFKKNLARALKTRNDARNKFFDLHPKYRSPIEKVEAWEKSQREEEK